MMSELPVVVIGAGPVVAHTIRQRGHVRRFAPWRHRIDSDAAGLLAAHGWQPPPADNEPTGAELVRDYLEPLAACLGPVVRLGARVVTVSRNTRDPPQSRSVARKCGRHRPMIDPNLHSCGTVCPHGALELAHPEPNFFISGIKNCGRAPTFLLATGHEQVRSIAAALTGDLAAAARVELTLPETGVCTAGPAQLPVATSCCRPGTRAEAEAAP
jgi:hypothetical protein